MQLLKNILSNTIHLFYPHVCTGCGSDSISNENLLCLTCLSDLPHTAFAQHANNPVEKIFWGRIHLKAAHSEFYFSKSSLIQHLIHELKYKGNKDIGFYLGGLMGNSLLNSHRFLDIDVIIPLPLFADKEFKRGYNQAAIVSHGISALMNIPVLQNNVTRKRATETQTKKHRTERWENVAESFMVKDPNALQGKNILLIYDVITTGATLEACANIILSIKDVQLSIATLALAVK
ncbi:MAG: ComF family protein [Chitinophagaceae bacterium]|nr:ComF family protein [Chitinophagaceae bacterium]